NRRPPAAGRGKGFAGQHARCLRGLLPPTGATLGNSVADPNPAGGRRSGTGRTVPAAGSDADRFSATERRRRFRAEDWSGCRFEFTQITENCEAKKIEKCNQRPGIGGVVTGVETDDSSDADADSERADAAGAG